MTKKHEIVAHFRAGSAVRKIALLKTGNDLYCVLPSGSEIYLAAPVRSLICGREGPCRLDAENFEQLMSCIDASGSDRLMVPLTRVGAGPTDKSARFDVKVIQSIDDGLRGPENEKIDATLTFTLPVSQIEAIGDQMAAPLWLITEKLKDKANSKWGSKFRSSNSIVGEFAPATLRAASSAKVVALKDWLRTVQNELVDEDARIRLEAAEKSRELGEIADQYLTEYLEMGPESFQKLKIKVYTLHGEGAASRFHRKVMEHRAPIKQRSAEAQTNVGVTDAIAVHDA